VERRAGEPDCSGVANGSLAGAPGAERERGSCEVPSAMQPFAGNDGYRRDRFGGPRMPILAPSGIAILSIVIGLSGRTSVRTTSPARTATEELLISTAAERG
jgi:hypothetical protein